MSTLWIVYCSSFLDWKGVHFSNYGVIRPGVFYKLANFVFSFIATLYQAGVSHIHQAFQRIP